MVNSPGRTVLAVWDNRLVYSIHNPKVHYFVNFCLFVFICFLKDLRSEGENTVSKLLMSSVKGMLHIVSQYEIMNVTDVHRRARTGNYRHVSRCSPAFACL